MFEQIPPWAMMQAQQQRQQPQFNPAPMIMSPFTRGVGNGQMPPQPQAPQPPPPDAGAAGGQQDPMAQFAQLFGNPNSSNNPATASAGSGGLIQAIAAMMNGRQQQQQPQTIPGQPDLQMPQQSQGGGGGMLDILKMLSMFK